MTELYESYIQSANALNARINAISEQISSEENIDSINSLKVRRNLLIEERFDLLEIANALRTGTTWGDFY